MLVVLVSFFMSETVGQIEALDVMWFKEEWQSLLEEGYSLVEIEDIQ